MQRLSQAAILSAPAAAPVASRSLAEAKGRARSFFREICREIPWVVKNYQLGEITTVGRLRSQLSSHFRRVETDNPKVIDLLLFKGQAEVHEVMAHYTQRHHLVRTQGLRRDSCAHAVAAALTFRLLAMWLRRWRQTARCRAAHNVLPFSRAFSSRTRTPERSGFGAKLRSSVSGMNRRTWTVCRAQHYNCKVALRAR